jgi:hypothetical protein
MWARTRNFKESPGSNEDGIEKAKEMRKKGLLGV